MPEKLKKELCNINFELDRLKYSIPKDHKLIDKLHNERNSIYEQLSMLGSHNDGLWKKWLYHKIKILR